MIVRELHKVRTMPGESPGKPFDNALLVNHCAERGPHSAKASAKFDMRILLTVLVWMGGRFETARRDRGRRRLYNVGCARVFSQASSSDGWAPGRGGSKRLACARGFDRSRISVWLAGVAGWGSVGRRAARGLKCRFPERAFWRVLNCGHHCTVGAAMRGPPENSNFV